MEANSGFEYFNTTNPKKKLKIELFGSWVETFLSE